MFSHVMIGADDIDASKAFYDAALGALGVSAGVTDEWGRVIYAHDGGRLVITKPVNEALLLARVRTQLRLKSMSDELRSMATTDGLTGLANRRHFDELMRREWQRCARSGSSIALLMADIDHFKRYNDSYGHPGGDACLQAVA